MTITPWAQGHLLIWDATCWDSFAASNLQLATSDPGRVADLAARRKKDTYREMAQIHDFVPIAVDTSGAFGEDTITFLHQLASHFRLKSKDHLEYQKLCQQISVCIQNYNCASILGCCSLILCFNYPCIYFLLICMYVFCVSIYVCMPIIIIIIIMINK